MHSVILERAKTLMYRAFDLSLTPAERQERYREIVDMLQPIIGD